MVTQMKYLLGATAALAVLILAQSTRRLRKQPQKRRRQRHHLHHPHRPSTPATRRGCSHPPPSCLMMTIPGLALFYGGMVRKKNVLATVGQAFGATCIITVLWMIIGYSIAFTTNDSESLNKWIGGFKYFMLKPMTIDAVSPLAATIPKSVYMCFQMTFAIITPALIAGSLGGPHEVLVLHGVHGSLAHPRL